MNNYKNNQEEIGLGLTEKEISKKEMEMVIN